MMRCKYRLKAYEQQDPYQLFIDSLKSKDILGRVYEYFLGRFADARGKKGGQFYTPRSIVKLLIEMLEPYKGRIFDPCCSSGGMFVQSEKFIKAHGGKIGGISIFWLLINFLIINFGRIL